MRYYVFTDLDNTITKSIEKLDDNKLDMITKMSKDICFSLVTSSYYSEVKHFLEVNNLKWNYICEGGALAYFNGLSYNKQFKLPINLLLPFQNNIVFLFYQSDLVSYVFNYLPYLASIYPKYSEIVKLNNINEIKHTQFNQIHICVHQTIRNQFVEVMEQHKIDVSLLMEDSKNVFFRLRAKRVNKGYFIPHILNDNNINVKDTLGFGDSIEDIAIMRQVDKKVAVQNAEPLLKIETNDSCEPVESNGVLNYLFNLLYENS